jgi:putative tryptophan/tyrosine transport system substrate-binding protein
MNRRDFIATLGGAAAWPLTARAQQQAMPVVGFLGGGAQATSAAILLAFREGLSSVGYIEGRNVVVEYRWAEDHIDRLPELAADLVGRKVAAIATAGASPAALAAKAATATIPIVFQVGVDPVGVGLVTSLNRPGGNVTGVTSLNRALEPKRMEVLHELTPRANIFVQIVNPTNTAISVQSREADAQSTGQVLGLQIQLLYASTERDFEKVFATAAQLHASGIAIAADPLFANHSDALALLAAQQALPTVSPYRAFAAAGGLMSYGDDLMDQYRELGVYLGHVLNGEKPGDMPVEQATKIELIVNLKTAKALGITVPLSLLGRADKVIE